MPRLTPFHPRTSALCTSLAWKEWAGYAAVCNYDRHSEREYFAFRHTAGMIDVSPLYKYDVSGPRAADLLARIWCRDIRELKVGQVVYSAMCDEHGKCLDDGTIARLDEDVYRMTSSEPWLRWLHRHARGLDVRIEDTTRSLAALSVQGPLSREILSSVTAWDLDKMRFFRCRKTRFGKLDGWISRTGYTGDLGFELWVSAEDAVALWDLVLDAGRLHGLEPAGLDAMDVTRIEAGFVLQGIDYVSARHCLIEGRKSTPEEAGLGWTVDLEREPFIGQEALLREREQGPRWQLVGLEISWPDLEVLYEEYGLPPHLAPTASRAALPVYDRAGGRQVGQATSSTWSPLLKRYLALAQVHTSSAAMGSELRIEHTVEFHRRQLPVSVVEKPFFDPERKKSTPKAGRAPARAEEASP